MLFLKDYSVIFDCAFSHLVEWNQSVESSLNMVDNLIAVSEFFRLAQF